MTVAGVDLGGSKIAGVLLDESGTVRGELWQEHRIQGPDQAVELIGEVVGELMARESAAARMAGEPAASRMARGAACPRERRRGKPAGAPVGGAGRRGLAQPGPAGRPQRRQPGHHRHPAGPAGAGQAELSRDRGERRQRGRLRRVHPRRRAAGPGPHADHARHRGGRRDRQLGHARPGQPRPGRRARPHSRRPVRPRLHLRRPWLPRALRQRGGRDRAGPGAGRPARGRRPPGPGGRPARARSPPGRSCRRPGAGTPARPGSWRPPGAPSGRRWPR